MPLLDRDEYVEQAYFFRALGDRLEQNMATQDLLAHVNQEVLSTTRLPMAIDFLASELRLNGAFAPAMAKLAHYFTAFQTFIVSESEREQGRFDFSVALEILRSEAEYRIHLQPFGRLHIAWNRPVGPIHQMMSVDDDEMLSHT